MTNEPPGTPDPTPASEPTATPPMAPPAAGSAMGSMSGETMVMAGAALALASYVIFSLILRDYGQSATTITAAILVLILFQMKPAWVSAIAPLPVLLKALGYIIATVGVLEFLGDVRSELLDNASTIIGAIVAYAGYVLAFLGARSIKP
ncbi:MAG TPA: hypothetical protein VGC03_15205 [Acidimicrobiia bacterium]